MENGTLTLGQLLKQKLEGTPTPSTQGIKFNELFEETPAQQPEPYTLKFKPPLNIPSGDELPGDEPCVGNPHSEGHDGLLVGRR